MKRHRVVSLRTLFLMVFILLVIMVCEVYRVQAVYDQGKQTYQVVYTQQERQDDATTLKVKAWYMEKNERIWGDLAEYQAAATTLAARKHRVDLPLLVGVVTGESDAHPFARSPVGAKGSGQVYFEVHGDRFPQIKEERDKYDPMKNIDASAELLKEYTSKYGLRGGLQAYNVGETAYRSGKRNPRYVAKVLKYAKQYRHF